MPVDVPFSVAAVRSGRTTYRDPRRGPALALLLVAVLGGCKLIDQRTFDRGADRRPVPHSPPQAPAKPGPPPLATVRFAEAPEDWQPALSSVVRQALARKPLALFTVQTVVPLAGDPAAQAAALAGGAGTGGRMVADTVVAAGASSSQLEMTATSDAAVSRPEVRVYVR